VIVRGTRKTFALLTLVVVAVLCYLELYPFAFRMPTDGEGPFRKLIESWAERPSRGDFVANVLAYIPLGLFATLALASPRTVLRWSPVVTIVGAALSVVLELTQYFVEGRVTSATDVCANTLGVLIGSAAALFWAANRILVLQVDMFAKPVPIILLIDWLAYRLYPYVPTTDLHKFWAALKALVTDRQVHSYDLWRHTSIWLTLFALVTAVAGHRRAIVGSFLLSAFILVAKIAIVEKALSIPEVAGAGLGLWLWPFALLFSKRVRGYVLAALLGGYVAVDRLQPFLFQDTPRAFGWFPFRSFMEGSLELNLMAFLEKSFLYGSLLFLLSEAGWRLRNSTLLVAAVLFSTSWAETYLPGRSAESTDAVLVMLIAAVFALLPVDSHHRRQGCRDCAPLGQ